jgi:ABC-2 type transport system permease protein
MRGIWTGYRLQLAFYRNYPDTFIPLLTAPLFTLIFAMIIRYNGRGDLSAYAVIAPFFMSLWWFALFHGGFAVQTDRWQGTIELQFAAPTSYPLVILGRILAVMTGGLLSFGEVWLFARYVLRVHLAVHHPVVLLVTLAATAFAMATTALFMAGLFVIARSAATFSNSASYPFYVLGGILVPVALLPGWIQPVSTVVFLSWSSSLLRKSLSPAPVSGLALGLSMIVVLGLAALGLATLLMLRIQHRVRATGELSLR